MELADTKLRSIENLLSRDAQVRDCAVRRRVLERGARLWVAYLVPSLPFSAGQLQKRLQSLLPPETPELAYVWVSSLPLDSEGQIDEERLARLPLFTSALVQQCEASLRSALGTSAVAVALEEFESKRLPLHLSDLLPDWRFTRTPPTAVTATRREGDNRQQAGSGRPAISHGEPLHVPVPGTMAEVLARAAKEHPEHGVIYCQADGGEVFQTYPELVEDAERILAGLRKLGLQPQDKLIFQLNRNEDFIPAYWACMLGGFVPVPISIAPSYREPNSTLKKLQNSWEMLGRPTVLAGANLTGQLQSAAQMLGVKAFHIAPIDELRVNAPDQVWHQATPDDMALMLLTSGSTGMPKGVMQSHANLLRRSAATVQMNAFTSDDISVNWFPLDHVGGIVMYHTLDVFLGAKQVQAPTEIILENPLRWLELVEKYRATSTWAPNFAFALINDCEEKVRARDWNLSSLRFILNGGEAIVARTARRFLQLLIPCGLPPRAMHPAWGMSETCSGVTFSGNFRLETTSDDDPFVEVGAPTAGTSLRIVDSQDQVVEEGKIGRLQIQGVSVTSGYYNNPELNHESFSQDGWFNTGDLAYLRDGRLTIAGRSKDVIIINGLNYYSSEIEAVVEKVAGVEVSFAAACAVRAPGSNTDQMAVFFSTPHAGLWEQLLSLMHDIRERMVREAGVNPDFLIPVEKSRIPKTSIGKIQRSQLREAFEAGEFDAVRKEIDIHKGNANTLPDWFYRKTWHSRQLTPGTDGLARGTYLIFADQLGLADLVVKALAQEGIACIRVQSGNTFARLGPASFQICASDPGHYSLLLQELNAEDRRVDHVLHLWSCRALDRSEDLETIKDSQVHGVYSLLYLIQAHERIQGLEHTIRLFVVSNHSVFVTPQKQDANGQEQDKLSLGASTLAGFLATVRAEMPAVDCHHIDLDISSNHTSDLKSGARCLLAELSSLKSANEVAYRKHRRFISGLSPVDLTKERPHSSPIQRDGLYLITGGLGGIGAQLATFLMREYEAKVLLVGRTKLPAESEWRQTVQNGGKLAERIQNYRAIQSAGAECIYRAIDVADLPALRDGVAEAEAHWKQPLAGIFHLAGEGNLSDHWKAVDERGITAATINIFDSMFHSKVYGTWALFQLVADRPEVLFAGFSSVNSIFGGATFSAYSAANSFLDACTLLYRHRSHPHACCFNWSMWDNVGMSRDNPEGSRNAARTVGYHILSTEQGLCSMVAGLARNEAQLIVGLDAASPHIQKHTTGSAHALQTLRAYVAAPVHPQANSANLDVRDQLGNRIDCELVLMKELPRTAAGEIDHEQLSKLRNPRSLAQAQVREPQTDIERQVAAIWQELLNLPRVSMEDRFFELGGDSLLAIRLVNRLRETFNIHLSLRNLFQISTAGDLAALITNQGSISRLDPNFPGSSAIEHSHTTTLLASVGQLTDADVDALLREMEEHEVTE
ncbi:MAG TPA: SDR family NAD(P)-dependent oxidoreductase [Terriglobales bacterium]|jgi:acyl-CoA synthetase (AMP-forming)/AMP-acid ligase II/NAD(P)-dependent dehydrogenase (short-subunit alcohol dehydrogenase family)/acyl carrier protein|nr:SDR family NAD(P)-dependent oxidoreductase [Terriglobales bacterium]